MTTKTLTVRRQQTVEQQIEVTFPVYRESGDDTYAGSVPYTRWTEISRLSECGTKLTVRKVETVCDSPDRVTQFSITRKNLDEREMSSDLAPWNWESSATPDEFRALVTEAMEHLGLGEFRA